jgi:DNA-directed RNA polymerase specialized sigma24 family protein
MLPTMVIMAGYDPLADALALAALLHVSPATVRSWAHRGRLDRRGRDPRGRTLYSIAEASALAPPPQPDNA